MKVNSIFQSIDGEVNKYGNVVTTFIRLSGCNCDCIECDTKYAQDIDSGSDMSVDQILEVIDAYEPSKVTITGGEPLVQKEDVYKLAEALKNENILVSLETNGTIPIEDENLHLFDSIIMDWKMGSRHMKIDTFLNLRKSDFIKFVIKDREEFNEAMKLIKLFCITACCARFALSPMHGKLHPSKLVEWMIKVKTCERVVLNLQLHKYIGVE